MIEIDGSQGEGGGQILRNACALSLITKTPFRIFNIRGNRKKPGLLRQHLTSIEAACSVGNAECEGLRMGASEIVFHPGAVSPGAYHFSVGTAGSTGLVLQTVLPGLLLADGASTIVLEGGTHNMQAPPFEFLQKGLFPILSRMGPGIEARLERHGFFPRGGGRVVIEITPQALAPLQFIDRGALRSRSARCVSAGLPSDIAQREVAALKRYLDWPDECFAIRPVPAEQGPGNIVILEAEFEGVTEVVSGFGELGTSAKYIAKRAAARMNGFIKSGAFAGPYLADQLIVPLALSGGGSFTTVRPSEHTRSAAESAELFLDQKVSFEQQPDGTHLVSVT